MCSDKLHITASPYDTSASRICPAACLSSAVYLQADLTDLTGQSMRLPEASLVQGWQKGGGGVWGVG